MEYSRPSGVGSAEDGNRNGGGGARGGGADGSGGGGRGALKFIRLIQDRIQWCKDWWVVEKATTYAYTYADHFKVNRASQLLHNQVLRRRRPLALIGCLCIVGMVFWNMGFTHGQVKGSANEDYANLHHKHWVGAPSGQ